MTAQAVKGLSTGRWNVIETRDGSEHTRQQFVWSMGGAGVSPASYVDELLLIDIDGGPDGDCDPDTDSGMESGDDRRYFVHQDREPLTRQRPRSGPGRTPTGELCSGCRVKGSWNVVALTEYGDDGVGVDGRVAERYAYTPYGEFVVFKGDAGSGELGRALATSPVGNVFAHQGLPFDAEKLCYQNRHREYMAGVERFGQRDPLGPALVSAFAGLAPPALVQRPIALQRVEVSASLPRSGNPIRSGDWSGLCTKVAVTGPFNFKTASECWNNEVITPCPAGSSMFCDTWSFDGGANQGAIGGCAKCQADPWCSGPCDDCGRNWKCIKGHAAVNGPTGGTTSDGCDCTC